MPDDLSSGYDALRSFQQGYQQREAGVEKAETERRETLKAPTEEARKALLQPRPELPDDAKLPDAPKPNFSEGAQQWVAVAAILSGLAGVMTRRHMTNALTAFAGAIQGFRQGKIEQYDQNYKTWKAETDKALAETESLYRKRQAILEDRKSNIDEKMANLQLLATETQDNVSYESAKLKRFTDFAVTQQTMADNIIRMKDMTARIQETHDALNERTLAATGMTYDDYVKARKDFDKLPAPQGETPAQRNQRFQEWSGVGGQQLISDEDARTAGQQLASGDTSVLTSWGRVRQGPQNLVKIRHYAYEQLREQFGEDAAGRELARIDAEYQGTRAGERTLGTRAANIGVAINELKQFIPIAVQISDKIDRSQFPTLNSVYLAAQKGSGGEAVARFIPANTAIINAYAQIIARSGVPTDQARTMAQDVLSIAYSKGQYRAAADQIMIEANAAERGVAATRGQIGGGGNTSAPVVPPAGGDDGWGDLKVQ